MKEQFVNIHVLTDAKGERVPTGTTLTLCEEFPEQGFTALSRGTGILVTLTSTQMAQDVVSKEMHDWLYSVETLKYIHYLLLQNKLVKAIKYVRDNHYNSLKLTKELVEDIRSHLIPIYLKDTDWPYSLERTHHGDDYLVKLDSEFGVGAIVSGPPLQVTLTFTPVTAELPKKDTRGYLVSYAYGVTEADFINGRFVLAHDWTTNVPEVTHWAFLPKRVEV